MSYEGYTQDICENGHRLTFDAYAFDSERVCWHCGSQNMVFSNAVDDTNCDESGALSEEFFALLQITKEVVEVCNLGHSHVTAAATYRVPTYEELVEWDSRSDPTETT